MPPPPPPQGPLAPHSQLPPHGPGPVLQHGPGPVLQHGPGPVLQHGPGPVLQHGPGPVLQHGPGGPPVTQPGHLNMMDPASNNAPLQFNPNKGKPPMAIPGKMGGPELIQEEDQMKLPGEYRTVGPGLLPPPHT